MLLMAMNFVVVIALLFPVHSTQTGTEALCNRTFANKMIQEGRNYDQSCLRNATRINKARARNESVPNVPKTDLTDRNVTFMLLRTTKPNDVQNLTTWNRTSQQHWSYHKDKLTMLHMSGIAGDANVDAEKLRPLLGSIDMNLIIVNWNSYSLSQFDVAYLLNNSVPALGRVCTNFVNKILIKLFGSSPDQIEMTGFSAGAQACGLCGKGVEPRVALIRAFDAASPCFASQEAPFRLAKGDAQKVLLYHCSSVLAVPPTYNGDTDYFVGCGGTYSIDCLSQTSLLNIGICSHAFCANYLLPSSTNPNNIVGVHCENEEQFFNKTCSYSKPEIVGFFSPYYVDGKIYAPIPYPLEPSYNTIRRTWLSDD